MGTFGTLNLGLGLTIRNRRNGGAPSIQWEEWIDGLTEAQVLDVDFGQTDRTWQNTTATTLADDAGESIALALDSGFWAGLDLAGVRSAATERVTNGTFDTNTTGWSTVSATLTAIGGKLSVSPADSITRTAYQQVSTGANRYHFLAFDYDQSTAVGLRYYAGVTNGAGDVIPLTSLTGVGSVSRGFLASAASAYFHFGAISSAGLQALYDNISLKSVPGSPALQATGNSQGKRQAGGVCRYDGSDDSHLTGFVAQSGGMTVYPRAVIPASLADVQALMGASGAGANRIWVGVDTSGRVCAGVGSDTNTTIVGTKDVRGKEIDVALVIDGTTVKLFLRVDGVVTEEYSGPQAGTPTTSVPFRIGAFNNNGTAGSFCAADAKRLRAAHKAMTLAEFTSISAAA